MILPLFSWKISVICEESTIVSATLTKPSQTDNYHACKQLSPLAGNFDFREIEEIESPFYPLLALWDVRIKNFELRCVGFAEYKL